MASKEISQVEEQAPCSPSPRAPILCANNCGFFGTRENNNLCSCCFKKALMASIKPSPSSSSVPDASPAVCLVKEESPLLCSAKDPSPSLPSLPSSTSAGSDPTLSVKEGLPSLRSVKEPSPSSTCAQPDPALSTSLSCAEPDSKPPSQKPNRCFSCRKRVGLTGFKCRCGDVFCAVHRYSDKHDCSFDYKAVAQSIIAKANPVVKADKVAKI
eukprot:c18920_g2_i1 orf=117-755(+)